MVRDACVPWCVVGGRLYSTSVRTLREGEGGFTQRFVLTRFFDRLRIVFLGALLPGRPKTDKLEISACLTVVDRSLFCGAKGREGVGRCLGVLKVNVQRGKGRGVLVGGIRKVLTVHELAVVVPVRGERYQRVRRVGVPVTHRARFKPRESEPA